MIEDAQEHSSKSVDIGCLDILAEWVETLHGQGELNDALQRLIKVTHAHAAFIARHHEGRISLKMIAAAGHPKGRPPCFLNEMLEDPKDDLRIGATLSLKEAQRNRNTRQAALQVLHADLAAYAIRDLLAVRLAENDFLELHFEHTLPDADRNLLAIMGPTLAKTWQSRLPGTAERARSRFRTRRGTRQPDPQVLHLSNPFGLTRSEFRVCMLVREGLLVEKIAHKLNVLEPTIRAHLRAIYMKTGISCHVELLHRLTHELSSGAPAGATGTTPRLHLN